MAEKFANDYATVLSAACTANAATITVPSAAPVALRGGEFRVKIEDEILLVTSGQDTTTWSVTRGAEGTTAAAHASGLVAKHVLTAAGLGGLLSPLVTTVATKADQSALATAAADIITVANAVATKADATATAAAIAAKADAAATSVALGNKADAAATSTALANKADVSALPNASRLVPASAPAGKVLGVFGGAWQAIDPPGATVTGYNVVDSTFSATANGAVGASTGTDAGPAINTAITAAFNNGGGEVVIPNYGTNVYLINTKIVLKSNVTLRIAPGVSLERGPTLQGTLITNAAATAERTGTDGAITSGTNIFTSATANFTAADVGKAINIVGAYPETGSSPARTTLMGYILAVTNSTTVTLTSWRKTGAVINATATVTGASWSIWTRDTSIKLLGGGPLSSIINSKDHGLGNVDTVGTSAYHVYFRGVDNLEIGNFAMRTGGPILGGKYSIAIFSCSRWVARDIDLGGTSSATGITGCTPSDGIHWGGETETYAIRNITGKTGDDFLACVHPDRGAALPAAPGDVTNGTIENIKGDTVSNVLNLCMGLLNGVPQMIRGLKILNVSGNPGAASGTTNKHVIRMGGSEAGNNDPAYGDSFYQDIEVERSSYDGTGTAKRAVQLTGGTYDNLKLRRLGDSTQKGMPLVAFGAGCIVNDVTVEDTFFNQAAAVYGIEFTKLAGTTKNSPIVRTLTLNRCKGRFATTGASCGPILAPTAVAATLDTLRFTDYVHETGQQSIGSLATTTTMFIRMKVLAHVSFFNGASAGVYTIREWAVDAPDDANAAATVIIKSKVASFRYDVSKANIKANAVKGDRMYNFATVTPLSGAAADLVGDLVFDGTVWKNNSAIFTAATF